mmetsp:Transcript_32674/g.82355  ORF Transcript_32674/g.82355 Transcript_32674/m.82355 type:complete len:163 (-) Transcript_32674:45-533(-)
MNALLMSGNKACGQTPMLPPKLPPMLPIEHPLEQNDAPRPNAFQALMAPSGNASHPLKIAGLSASEFFLNTMKKGGTVGAVQGERSEKKKAVTCFKFFNNMATPEERAQLLPPPPGAPVQDPGQQRVLVAQLEKWVVVYIVERFENENQDVRASLKGSNVSL